MGNYMDDARVLYRMKLKRVDPSTFPDKTFDIENFFIPVFYGPWDFAFSNPFEIIPEAELHYVEFSQYRQYGYKPDYFTSVEDKLFEFECIPDEFFIHKYR